MQFDPAFSHSSIHRLHINNNAITKWEEIAKLSSAFPNLQKLVAASLPLVEIPQQNSKVFPSVSSLYLNDSSLGDWASVEHLTALPKLSELSILNLPLSANLKEKERRFAVIGRLPDLQSLNKSSITETEREDAERWLIRQFLDDPSPPSIYHSLVAKHGKVDKLVDVDLKPKVKARVEFHFEDKCEYHTIKLEQTVKNLKQWLSGNFVGFPPSSFCLFHHDPESYCGTEQMRYENRLLYSCGVKDGDKIYIELKQSTRRR